MSSDVYVYDSSYAALQSGTVNLIAMDGVTTLVSQANGSMSGGLWGAHLSFTPSNFVLSIHANDSGGTYAPVSVTDLNGSVNGRLDLVLSALPPAHSAGGASPSTAQAIEPFIDAQSWTTEGKAAMRSLIRALSASRPSMNPTLRQMAQEWERWLDQRGISPRLI
jgi:hypothetical protein